MGRTSVIRLSAIITDQDKHIQELKQQVADRDKVIAEYQAKASSAVEKMQTMPVAPNWLAIREQIL